MLQLKQQREPQSRDKKEHFEDKKKKKKKRRRRRSARSLKRSGGTFLSSCNPRRALGSSRCITSPCHPISVNKCKMEIWVILKLFPCTNLYSVMQYSDLQQTSLQSTLLLAFSDSHILQKKHTHTHTHTQIFEDFRCIAATGQLGL